MAESDTAMEAPSDTGAAPATASFAAHDAAPLGPVLSQKEIDALSGFRPLPATREPGSRGMVDGPAPPVRPMPMLQIVLDEFAKAETARLRKLFGADAGCSVERWHSARYGAYVEDLPRPVQSFRLKAEGWGGTGLAVVQPALAYLVLDLQLGAGSSAAAVTAGERAPTAIETGILTRFVSGLLAQAGRSFSVLEPVSFVIERVEADPRRAEAAEPSDTTLVVRVRIEIAGRAGTLDLVWPSATLAPVRGRLSEPFMGSQDGVEAGWGASLATEVWQASVAAEAVLHETRLPLGQVMDLAVGDTLMFDMKANDLVDVRCGGLTLTRGRIGRVDGQIAIQVVEPLRRLGASAGRTAARMPEP